MARFFIPRRWKLSKLLWIMLALEFPLTVANLTLFGIASPNTYRTKLWQEGGNHGFNSDPSTLLYAYANYRPVKTPVVWSNNETQFNLVIGVLSTFIYLTKVTMFITHVFYPIVSLLVHLILTSLFAYGVYVQSAPDTIDPKRQNHGLPWYVTKNCNLSSSNSIKGYCQQAKAAWAVTLVMLMLFAVHVLVSVWSLIPTKDERITHQTKVAEKKAEKEKFSPIDDGMTAEQQWQHMWELQQLPRTPGTAGGMRSPMTPRTKAFTDLGGAPPTPGYYGVPSPIYENPYEGKGKDPFRGGY
ncbi:hypothetical protein GQ43DRAFT_413406 [Delitschia confertaspora ATCC 74209]|uniref:MARVEL domain-containing protein n=1 Tax=Delitschia confertaspora ATCC 74209 TaxID=1513339 RepID=A0A9P4JSU9_9PLEO|nr:hypothetical protein GQ43DRAFT_413406 [Delitschia confertaspora ATCC 74209]